jgi:hypothetical protein
MRIIRNTILAGVAVVALPLAGFTHHVSTFLTDAQHRLAKLAEAATGEQPGDFRAPDVRIRWEPHTSSAVRGLGGAGDGATVDRVVTGETIACSDGRSTAEWFHITNRRTHVDGYVSACYL